MNDTLIEKIKVLDLRGGDVICLLSPHILSEVAFNNLKTAISEGLDISKNKILILEQGMDIKLIRTETLKAELKNEDKTNHK